MSLLGWLNRYVDERVQLAMRLQELEREAQQRHLCGLSCVRAAGDCRCARWAHEFPNPLNRSEIRRPALTQLEHEVRVFQGLAAEDRGVHPAVRKERLDFGDKLIK
jgi:hypothetical protein